MSISIGNNVALDAISSEELSRAFSLFDILKKLRVNLFFYSNFHYYIIVMI